MAFAIDHGIAFVTLFADSLLGIELLAGSLDLAANALAVEVVSVRALEAGVVAPDLAAEVVIEGGEEGCVLELVLRESELLCAEGRHQEQHQDK